MANTEGKGSIFLKLTIFILFILLVAVIIIPGRIWNSEESESTQSRMNIASLYEAEKFYHRLTKQYTSEPSVLMEKIHQDSTLLIQKQIVNLTTEIKVTLDNFLAVPYVNSILVIDQNIQQIIDDLRTNKRFFVKNEGLNNSAEELLLNLTNLKNNISYQNFSKAAAYLDSLRQLRRDMSDYTLQNISARSKAVCDSMNKICDKIEYKPYAESWSPLALKIQDFARKVDHSELSGQTSVADRILDFQDNVTQAFNVINVVSHDQNLAKSREFHQKFDEIYKKFLQSFNVTSRSAMYKLSLSDSLVLHLTENNFTSPVNGETYKLIISPDSSTIKVEDPVLLTELQNAIKPITSELRGFSFLPILNSYLDSVESINKKSLFIKDQIKRNTDIFIKTKEVEALKNNYSTIGIVQAKSDLENFLTLSEKSESYSEIQTGITASLEAVKIFQQAYEKKIFGKLDSLHMDYLKTLTEFDSELAKIKKLPDNVSNFEKEQANLNNELQKIKNIDYTSLSGKLAQVREQLEKAYLFTEEGKDVKVYGIFTKEIKNLGFIERDQKSWEIETK